MMLVENRLSRRRLEGQPVAMTLALLALVFLAALVVALSYLLFDVHPALLLRDPNAVAEQPEYYGVVSNAGAIGWIAAAAVSLFTWLLLKRYGRIRRYRFILLFGGLLTAFSAFDDLFMFHEGLAPRMGLPQETVLVGYAVLGAAWLVASARSVLETDWLLILIAVAGLGTSLILDLGLVAIPGEVFFEDIAKLCGITFWTAYFLRLSWRSLVIEWGRGAK